MSANREGEGGEDSQQGNGEGWSVTNNEWQVLKLVRSQLLGREKVLGESALNAIQGVPLDQTDEAIIRMDALN